MPSAQTRSKKEGWTYACSGLQVEEHSSLGARPGGDVDAQASDAVHFASLLDDAVQLGHGQVVERLTGDL